MMTDSREVKAEFTETRELLDLAINHDTLYIGNNTIQGDAPLIW